MQQTIISAGKLWLWKQSKICFLVAFCLPLCDFADDNNPANPAVFVDQSLLTGFVSKSIHRSARLPIGDEVCTVQPSATVIIWSSEQAQLVLTGLLLIRQAVW